MIRRPFPSSTARRGFTLIEAALATVVIGVGFVAALQLIATGTVANVQATSLTTGMNLARGMNEYLLQQKFADLPNYHGVSYSPPKDSRGLDISGMSDWKQQIAVVAVEPSDLTKTSTDSPPLAVRVTVTVSRHDTQVSDLTWYVFNGAP